MSERQLEIIHPGWWVRLTTSRGKGVPASALGKDAAVLDAPTRKNEGDSSKGLSPRNYETQPDDTVFQVRVRETGEVLNVKRSAFRAWATNPGGLVAASME